MNEQLYIPSKLNVGFQKRNDTFTGQLAYIIYYDMKGVLRKEKSWQTWRDHKIAAQEITNEPTEGFVLNKKVGGYKSDWNYRDAHVRVYDPRNFEFEITVPNLLFILTQCDCSRGKGLEGKFVYAWQGTELILLPERSEEYQKSKTYTILQAQQVKAKELVAGASYITKKQQLLTYLGKFDYHQPLVNSSYGKVEPALTKRYIFWDGKKFVDLESMKTIAATAQADATPDLAELTQLYYKSPHGSPVKEIFVKDLTKRELNKKGYWRSSYTWVHEESPGVYEEYHSSWSYDEKPTQVDAITSYQKISLKDGVLVVDNNRKDAYRPGSQQSSWYGGRNTNKWIEPTGKCLWAKLESGAEYRIQEGKILTPTEMKNGEEDE